MPTSGNIVLVQNPAPRLRGDAAATRPEHDTPDGPAVLVGHSHRGDAHSGTDTEPAWRHKPGRYPVATEDRTIPPAARRTLAQQVIAQPGPRGGTDGLIGRSAELTLVDRLLAVSTTRSAALYLTGAAGVGKSALLDAAARRAEHRGFRVMRAAGAQFDQHVAFAGLNQILLPLAAELASLPGRQARTLQVILGLAAGEPEELTTVAYALRELLFRIGTASSPLALVIDDYGWLDRPSAAVLGTVARHTGIGRVALLAASRRDDALLPGMGHRTHEVPPLDPASAKKLVAERHPDLTPAVRRRLLAEAEGNPLALLELPVPLSLAQRTQRCALPTVLPLTERLRTVFSERVGALPDATRKLLLLAVLDGTGDLHLLSRTGDASGTSPELSPAELSPAEEAGLVRVDTRAGRLVFRHPLTRSAVMELSTGAERRWAHRTLADVLPEGSAHRALHLAGATVGPDDRVAALVHEAAYTTLRRGDAVGAVSALRRASELSGSGTAKGRRLAEAACLSAHVTGDLRDVRALLDAAAAVDPAGTASPAAAAAAAGELLHWDGDADGAHRLLVEAITDHDPGNPADDFMLGEALHTLLMVCSAGGRPELWQAFDTILARHRPHTPDPLLPVLRGALGDPAHAALPVLPRLDELISGLHRQTDPTAIVRTAAAATYVDRLPGCRSALLRVAADGRDGGAVASAIPALLLLADDAYAGGRWDDVAELTDEALQWCASHDYRLQSWRGRLLQGLLAAARGDDETARSTADRLASWSNPRGLGAPRVHASHINALSALGRADFESAYRHLTSISPERRPAPHVPHALRLIWDFTEAATRTGHHDEAAAYLAAVRDASIPSISPRLAMITEAATALADPHGVDRELFDKAVATPGAEHWPFDLARIRLGYGERLRRAQANVAARPHLEAALETFERLGAAPWSARAVGELRASGQAPVPVRSATGAEAPLTPQEWQIAQLAATGLTNKQIAAQLFLSHRTVAAHLRGAFRKLDISSRGGLRDALTGIGRVPVDSTERRAV
ncbi:AAA family ATPase [Streptomyces sp. NPDC001930]|uniref:AAA family ATPase n=1 Tax=Streptomyces sp. NPDC001930 TaxID=3364625 RepID=UPI0036B7CAA0